MRLLLFILVCLSPNFVFAANPEICQLISSIAAPEWTYNKLKAVILKESQQQIDAVKKPLVAQGILADNLSNEELAKELSILSSQQLVASILKSTDETETTNKLLQTQEALQLKVRTKKDAIGAIAYAIGIIRLCSEAKINLANEKIAEFVEIWQKQYPSLTCMQENATLDLLLGSSNKNLKAYAQVLELMAQTYVSSPFANIEKIAMESKEQFVIDTISTQLLPNCTECRTLPDLSQHSSTIRRFRSLFFDSFPLIQTNSEYQRLSHIEFLWNSTETAHVQFEVHTKRGNSIDKQTFSFDFSLSSTACIADNPFALDFAIMTNLKEESRSIETLAK